MIERGRPDVSIVRQCQLVQVSRSSVYYVAKAITAEELELRRRIDEIYLEHPFMGSRQIVRMLGRQGLEVNRKRVQRLMRLMGLCVGLARTHRCRSPSTRSTRTCSAAST